MYKLFTFFQSIISVLLTEKYWNLKIASVCVLYCILTSMPNYPNLFESSLKKSPYFALIIENYKAVNTQIDHPFKINKVDPASHSSKISFRFVPALLTKILPTTNLYSRILWLYLMNNLAGFVFFLSLINIVFSYSRNKLYSSLVAFNFSVLYIGKSFFHDTYLWNDGIAFTFLLLSLLSKNRLIVLTCLLAAYFTDERAIFGGVLALVFARLSDNNPEKPSVFLTDTDLPYIFSFIAYAVIRLSLMYFFNLQTPIGLDNGVSLFMRINEHPFWLNLLGLFTIYKMAWVLIISNIWWLRKQTILLVYYILGVFSLIIISLSVEDITRSFAYSFMALVSGFYLYYNKFSLLKIKKPEYGVFLFLFTNILIPTISMIGGITKILPPIEKLFTRYL